MKKTLRKMLLAGVFIAASLGINAQNYSQPLASQKEIKKELGINKYEELNRLGNGYITLKDSERNRYSEKIKIIESMNRGDFELEGDEKTMVSYGRLPSGASKKTLEEIDCIKKDYILTPEEISKTFNQKYQEYLRKQ